MYPGTRYRSDLTGTPGYFMLGSANPGNAFMWGAWHYVEIDWTNYIYLKMFIDGNKVIDYAGMWIPASWVCLNGVIQTDEMQVGTFCFPSWWQGPWQPPRLPFWNDYSESTVDTPMTSLSAQHAGNYTPPDRYPRSNGGTTYVADFTFPASVTGNVTVNCICFTSRQPTTDGSGNNLPPPQRPQVKLEWYNPSSGGWSPALTDAGGGVGIQVPYGQKFRYQALWYDNGLSPNTASAYLDDVTIYYTTTMQYLSYTDDPN